MSAKEAFANELKEAGRGVQANLEGKAGQHTRQDAQPQQQQHSATQEAGEARQQAAEAQQEHHAAAHTDYEAQRDAQAAEAEAAQEQSQQYEGPEYGD
ncbi:MAG: hypothetical protein ACRC8S_21610 [Fimbriiglobus sp.]